MSISPVSNRPAPEAMRHLPAREPVRAASKQVAEKPKVQSQAVSAHAQPTYTHSKDKPAPAAKGQRVDVKA